MGLQSWVQGKLGLTAQDRQSIFRLFGSFNANKIGLSDDKFIEEGYEKNVDVLNFITKNGVTLQVTVLRDSVLRFRYATTGIFGKDFSSLF